MAENEHTAENDAAYQQGYRDGVERVVSGVRAWCAINEIAAPPLDWEGLGEFLTRILPPVEPRCNPVGGVHALWCPDRPDLPIHRTEAGYPNCSTCDGGGCYDCTDPA